MKNRWVLCYPLSGCPGWSESSLGAQVILLLMSCCGSVIFFDKQVIWPKTFNNITYAFLWGWLLVIRIYANVTFRCICEDKTKIIYCFTTVFKSFKLKQCLIRCFYNWAVYNWLHPRSLISTFVVRCFDSVIFLDSIAEIFKTLASLCGCAGRLVSGLVGNSRRHVLSCRGSYIINKYPNEWKTALKLQGRLLFTLGWTVNHIVSSVTVACYVLIRSHNVQLQLRLSIQDTQ